jgi:ribosomal protein S27E
MNLICPECKNQVDLSHFPDISSGTVIECNMCGITLMVNNVSEDEIKAEIIEEGK